MAEGGPPPEPDVHLLECPICLERLQQPKSLPCQHSFCQECLETYITKEVSGKIESATSFSCPVCRRITYPVNQAETKDKWTDQFPTNAVIKGLITLEEDSSKPLYCKSCKTKDNITRPAQFWCKILNVNFCETCKLQLHDILHTDCDILDITLSGTKPSQSVPRCDRHGKKIVRFCDDHRCLCCNECVIEDHRKCGDVTKTTEYYKKLKTGTQLEKMQALLKKGVDVMDLFVKDFDEQLRAMVQNQEIALQSISDLRRKIDKRIDKLQKDLTDELNNLFKERERDIEASSRHCQSLMNGMRNTLKSTVRAVEENNHTKTIVMYQRGQAEMESCKTLVTEMSKCFTSVRFEHQIVLTCSHGDINETAMGKILVEKKPRHIPGSNINLSGPLSERHVKEVGKIYIKSFSDQRDCWATGVAYLPCVQIVVSDYSNRKLKLFSDKGQYLDELTVRGYPRGMCLLSNNTVAVAAESPGGVRVVKVEASKLSLFSEIDMCNSRNCYGVIHTEGNFMVGSSRGELYSLTQDGRAKLLHNYNNTCWSLAHDPIKGDALVSVSNTTPGDVAVSRLSADKRRTDVLKVGVVRGATGIDVDREGNIYVCGCNSNNIVQISGDGTRVRVLQTSSDGLLNPHALAVFGDKFVVTNISGTDTSNYLRVFQFV